MCRLDFNGMGNLALPRWLAAFVVLWALMARNVAGQSAFVNVAVQSSTGNASGVTYATPIRQDSAGYWRCKTTHRCNRATAAYDIDAASYLFLKYRFDGGREEHADLFLDFEDWKSGTVGLGVDHVRGAARRRCPDC